MGEGVRKQPVGPALRQPALAIPLWFPLRPPPGLRLLPSEPPASMLPGDTHSFFFLLFLFLNERSLMGFLLSDS